MMNNWQSIETAPKGGGADRTDDPRWVEPPDLLMAFSDGSLDICHWDWYYAPGGNGYTPGLSAWIGREGEQVARFQGDPVAWMPLPSGPGVVPAPEGVTDGERLLAKLVRVADIADMYLGPPCNNPKPVPGDRMVLEYQHGDDEVTITLDECRKLRSVQRANGGNGT